ncbi:MAG: hypothetical protein RLZZ502_729 [Pseudomonadota bacterium]|jgi:acetolactate synthase-1/2/3 large subunit
MNDTITVGGLIAAYLAAQKVARVYGVISIHNMPILDGIHTQGQLRFISARGEAGACNMADADARVRGGLGACITSTGTGAGNAAGALIEAYTAGTPMLHLTGQIESSYLDQELGFIHEAKDQLGMLASAGKACLRIHRAEHTLAVLQEATRLALTPPCGPVSIEVAIDIQKQLIARPPHIPRYTPTPLAPCAADIDYLKAALKAAQRPLLWLGGGARAASDAATALADLGIGIITSTQGRGVVREDHPLVVGAFNVQKATQALYQEADLLIVVGSHLRSNETLSYKLALPHQRIRIDAHALANGRAYPNEHFICADAALTLNALAHELDLAIDPDWANKIKMTRAAAEAQVDQGLGAYVALKNSLKNLLAQRPDAPAWVRDITLSNTMWGNRSLPLTHSRQGVHALGGGIGQGLAMGIGAALANHAHGGKALALIGDGGLQLNLGELACAVQEQANLMLLVMNDGGYGVIKNIQDVDYGGRHCYVDLFTPHFATLCAAMGIKHFLLRSPADTEAVLGEALAMHTAVMVEVDMHAWGPFTDKFAGPARK